MQHFDPAADEVKESFATIDVDGSGSIEFNDFLALMLKLDHCQPKSALRVRFAELDTNHDGRISEMEFRAWLGADGR